MRTVLRIAFATALALAPSVLHATDANLDPSFGSYGWTTINPGVAFNASYAVAVQTDGRIVIAGNGTVARYTSAGMLDPTFGTGGIANAPSGKTATAVAIQSDGAIVVAGTADTLTLDTKLTVFRLDASGTLDATFGTGGTVDVQVGTPGFLEFGSAVALQSDGRIVAVGTANGAAEGAHVMAVRLTTAGALDGTFGTGGVVELAFSNRAFGEDVAIQSDGKIVIGGYQNVPYFTGFIQAFMLLRLDTAGALDPTFNGSGVVVNGPRPEGSAVGYAVAIQPDDKILLGGFAGSSPHVLRYLPSGIADSAFGDDGIAKTVFDTYEFAPMFDLVLRPDGKIVLAGSVSRGSSSANDTALVRFNGDGSLDTTFTATGRVRIPIGSRQSVALDAAQQADGKLLVAGYRADDAELGTNSDTEMLLARLGGSCGDAFLDAGEQCDDGNTDGFDCCSLGCGFDPAGQICTGDASRCTYDTCDGAGSCLLGGAWPPSECLAVTQPLASQLTIRDSTLPGKDKLKFKWAKGPDYFYFGLPTLITSYSMCVFGGAALASEHEIPASGDWKSTSKGWKYRRDSQTAAPGGIYSARLTGGLEGRSRITVKGKGPFFTAPTIPLATPVTAQLVSSDGRCFGATYAMPPTNTGGKFNAKGQ